MGGRGGGKISVISIDIEVNITVEQFISNM